MLVSGGVFLAQKPQILELKIVMVAGHHLGVHLPVPLNLRGRDTNGDSVPDVLQSTSSSPALTSVVQVATLQKLLDQGRSLTINRFVLKMVQSHYFSLGAIPCYSILSHGLTLRLLCLIILLPSRIRQGLH